jgi:hypothetical protein
MSTLENTFKPYNLYKHKDCIDVAFRPMHITKLDDKFLIQGYWVGATSHKILAGDVITVKQQDIKNWREWYEQE